MMFDKEEWQILKDSEPRLYCGIMPNTVTVYPRRGKEREVYVAIPSALFAFLKSVLKVSREDMQRRPVRMMLEAAGDHYVFAILLPGGDVVDLWNYRQLPGWAIA